MSARDQATRPGIQTLAPDRVERQGLYQQFLRLGEQ